MLSTLTLLSLQRHTCMLCEQPLKDEHTYPLIEPGQLLSQTTDAGPHHPDCAQQHLEHTLRHSAATQLDTPYLAALWTVQAGPSSPSGRILRIHDHDPDSTCLHLFTPLRIDIIHTTATRTFPRAKDFHLITRPATYEECRLWIEPAVADALHEAPADQVEELEKQIHRLHKFLPRRPKLD